MQAIHAEGLEYERIPELSAGRGLETQNSRMLLDAGPRYGAVSPDGATWILHRCNHMLDAIVNYFREPPMGPAPLPQGTKMAQQSQNHWINHQSARRRGSLEQRESAAC